MVVRAKEERSVGFKQSSIWIAGLVKGAVSRNSAKLGNYKMPVELTET